jgi:hypothetical protein
MKNVIVFLILLLSYSSSFGESIQRVEGFQQQRQQRINLSGSIGMTNFHQGGAPKQYMPARVALPDYSLNLIRFFPGDSIPRIVKTFNSDSIGNFSLKVHPGIYGFVGVHDSIMANQWLPAGNQSMDDMLNSSSTWWECWIEDGPIVVKDKDISGIGLTRHTYSVCGMCP